MKKTPQKDSIKQRGYTHILLEPVYRDPIDLDKLASALLQLA